MNPKGHDFEVLPCYFLVTLNMLFLSLYLHIYVKHNSFSLKVFIVKEDNTCKMPVVCTKLALLIIALLLFKCSAIDSKR